MSFRFMNLNMAGFVGFTYGSGLELDKEELKKKSER